ncbi:MAG: Smr/MutS family protein [Spirochaetales bacterium]|nr:Smr/MutS family protein [Spirochaetales bacterium]
MKFDEIFSQWEKEQRFKPEKKNSSHSHGNPRGRTPSENRDCSGDRDSPEMKDWLEMYPPDRKMAQRKETPDRIIIHTRKKELSRMDPQDSLDLHGWNGKEAIRELEAFLKKSKRRGLKKVIVIHGKGLHSPGGTSVLRPLVKQYLEQSSLVRDYGRAKSHSGGGGATWILIR